MHRSRAARRAPVESSRPRLPAHALARAAAPARVRALHGALATAGVAALLAYLALTPLVPFARDTYGTEARRHLILATVILLYAAGLVAARRLPARTPLDLPIVAVLFALGAGVLGSIDRRLSLESALVVLPSVPLFYILADRRLVDSDALRRGVMLAAVVVACFALRTVWDQWQEWLALVRAVDGGVTRDTLLPPTAPRVAGVGSHPNVIGAVLALAAPFFVLSLVAKRRVERVGAGVGLALAAAALFFTLSRAAWVAAAIGVLVTVAGMAGGAGIRRLQLRWWLAGAGVGLALAMVALLALGHARPDWLFRDSLDPRADMRRVGLDIFRDNPLTGAGPGLYVALYPEYGGAYPFAAVHSHNVVVQIAADYGLLGLAAGSLMVAAVGTLLVKRYRRARPGERRLVAASAGALAAFLVDGLAESPHLFPEVLVLLAAATGLALRAAPEAERSPRRISVAQSGSAVFTWLRRRASKLPLSGSALPALAALVVGVALAPTWLYIDRAAAQHQQSVGAASRDRIDAAIGAARRATERDPRFGGYYLQLGSVTAARYLRTADPSDRDAAIRAYERGLDLEARNGAAWVDLAALRLDAGDATGAWSAIDRLKHLAGRDNLLQLAYAVLVQRAGTEQQAVETYAGLLALNPTLALTPFWRDDDFRSRHYNQIVDRALVRAEEITGPGAGADSLRAAIRLLTGRNVPAEEELRDALAAAPGDVRLQVALGRLLIAVGRHAEAEPLLRGAVARQSDSADAHAALGDWYAARGDARNSRREWLAAAYLGDVGATDALGESFPPGAVPESVIRRQQRLVEGAGVARFYLPFQTFRFTFLRHEPVPIILAGDWLDALPDEYPGWVEHLKRWQSERGRLSSQR